MRSPLQSILVPNDHLEAIAKDIAYFNREVARKDLPIAVRHLSENGQRCGYNLILPFINRYTKPTILEIGSGYGFGLCFLLKNRFDACGIEPGATSGFEGRYERACELLRHNDVDPTARLLEAVGESLPFEDERFDIFSIAVLEHVRDPDRVMAEAVRVCKPGGVVVMNVPNYDSFFEGHYNVPWLPYFLRDKRRAAKYVERVWGRNPYFVQELNFTTPRQYSAEKHWARDAAKVLVLPGLCRPLSRVSALAYFLSIESFERHRVLAYFAETGALRAIRAPVRMLSRSMTTVACSLGLAPVFNVIVEKRRHRAPWGAERG